MHVVYVIFNIIGLSLMVIFCGLFFIVIKNMFSMVYNLYDWLVFVAPFSLKFGLAKFIMWKCVHAE